MKITRIISQHRRDFVAMFECEHCGAEERRSGCYDDDDDNYHQVVIPQMRCKVCDKPAPESYEPRATKYPAWQVV